MAKTETIRKLSDFYKAPKSADVFIDISEIKDQNLVLRDIKVGNGQYGEYVFLTLEKSDGEVVKVNTGQRQIMEACQAVTENDALPCMITFRFDRKWGGNYIWRME